MPLAQRRTLAPRVAKSFFEWIPPQADLKYSIFILQSSMFLKGIYLPSVD
jgi:hypothetical protein